jgi:hypothetical protein
MRGIHSFLLISALWAISLSSACFGDEGRGNAHGKRLSQQEAASIAKQHGNGRVLSLDRSDREGREQYRAKVLSRRGVVSTIRIDRESGAVSPSR